MCDVLIPALIGVAALGLLGGGIGGDSCNPCGPTAGGYSITIPQEVGDVTHGVPVAVGSQQQYAYAPHPMYAGQSAYGAPAYPSPAFGSAGYGAPAPVGYAAQPGVGVGANIGDGAVGAGGYMNGSGVGVDANVGGFDASVGIGDRAY